MSSLSENKDARHKYLILETIEAGLILTGHETKSARRGTVSLKGSYVVMKGEEPFLVNAHIGSFQPGNAPDGYDPLRSRKLLMQKKEINRLLGIKASEGVTLIPLKIYASRGKIKAEIGVARSKSKKDKREDLKKKDANREIARALRAKP